MIYFMRAGGSDYVKIGWTRDQQTLEKRKIGLQTAQPHPLVIIRVMDDVPRWAEIWLHGFFGGARAAGEWFEFQDEMLTVECPNEQPYRLSSSGTSNLTKHFGLRIPLDLWGRLDGIAKQRGISVAAVLLSPWDIFPPVAGRPAWKPTYTIAEVECSHKAAQAVLREDETRPQGRTAVTVR